MIGAANSPMNMFTQGTGDAFQRGMVIGDANSPFSPIARAFQSTIDKYNAHLTSQQDQQNKMQLMQQQYGLQGQNQLALDKQKFEQSAPQLSPDAQQVDPMHPEDPRFMRNVAGVQMYPQAVYDSYGRVKGHKYVNPRALSMMDMITGDAGTGAGSPEEDAVNSSLQNIRALQAQLPEGM